jgi:hypothetical protein
MQHYVVVDIRHLSHGPCGAAAIPCGISRVMISRTKRGLQSGRRGDGAQVNKLIHGIAPTLACIETLTMLAN